MIIPATPALFGLPGGSEWIVILIVALLIFGRRLPDVARSIGKSIVEFKKGIRDIDTDIDAQSRFESTPPNRLEGKPAGTAKSSNEPARKNETPSEPASTNP